MQSVVALSRDKCDGHFCLRTGLFRPWRFLTCPPLQACGCHRDEEESSTLASRETWLHAISRAPELRHAWRVHAIRDLPTTQLFLEPRPHHHQWMRLPVESRRIPRLSRNPETSKISRKPHIGSNMGRQMGGVAGRWRAHAGAHLHGRSVPASELISAGQPLGLPQEANPPTSAPPRIINS